MFLGYNHDVELIQPFFTFINHHVNIQYIYMNKDHVYMYLTTIYKIYISSL